MSIDPIQAEYYIEDSKALPSAIEKNDATALQDLLEPLPLAEAPREILQLDSVDRAIVLSLVSADLAAAIIEEAPHETGADLLESLEVLRASEIMDELDSDVQADLIGDMEHDDAEAILQQMDAEDAADVRRLADYESDTAGGLMMAEVFVFSDR